MLAYFETSALVKLIIQEEHSDQALTVWNSADGVHSSIVALAESLAAVAQARRAGRITGSTHEIAKLDLGQRFRWLFASYISRDLAERAGELAEQHELRGYDAIHLASALALEARDLVLVTWDRALARAAGRSGLQVVGAAPN